MRIIQYWCGCPQTPNSKWRRFLEIIRRCASFGWQTCLVWSEMPDDPHLVEPFRACGCDIVLHPRPAVNFDLSCILRVYKLARRLRCDVFHCHNVHTSPLIGAALAGVPVRIWSKLAMSPYYERGSKPKGVHRLQLSARLSSVLASRVLALSGAVRDELLQLGVSSDRVHVVRGPVDLDRCRQGDRDAARAALGWQEDDLVITTVGHAVPVKGWDVLVEAFARLAHHTPRARLALVGSCATPAEQVFAGRIRERLGALGLGQRVKWLGQRGDVPAILAATDIFAFPSRSDGQGLALTEAMAAGLPCIAAAVGGIPELIQHGANGLLFNREDVSGLTSNLSELLRDSARRQRLGRQARQDSESFGMPCYADAIIRQYQEISRTCEVLPSC